jgi:transposase
VLNKGVQRKHKLWSKVGQRMLRELPLKPWAARRREDLLRLMAMLDQQIAPLDQAVKAEAQRDKMALLLETQPGVGAITALAYVLTMGDVRRFPRGKQVASYLGLIPREHSSGGRQKLGAITKQGNRMLRMLLVEAAQSAVLASLSPKAESGGQGGSGQKISRATLLDAAHPDGVSGGRSYREQPAGAPGRRKLDREC